ncbi:MAG: FG-GAP-like repeat-containing protein, partial [Bacteroidota bacterium]
MSKGLANKQKISLSLLLRVAFVLTLLALQYPAFAQSGNVEVCDDGIDNDGNGLIDCNDPFCNFPVTVEKGCRCFDNIDNDGDGRVDKADSNCATYYGLSFVGEGSNCSIVPPGAATPFDLVGPPAVSGQNTADTQSKVSVGDIDGDGIPDALITSKWNAEIRVVATSNGQADGSDAGDIKADFKTTGQGAQIFSGSGGCNPKNLLFEHENLTANIDKTGPAEVFGIVSNRGGNPSTPPTCFYLVGFRYTPGDLVPLYDAITLGSDRPGTFGIADMDGDGKAEIYLRDRIYAAETGALLASANGNWDLDVTSGPVAVNISGDSKMELVCGTKIYSIPSLTNRNPASPAALTLVADMNTIGADKCYVKLMVDPIEYGQDTHSACSVADIDRDGNIDVVISGALNSVTGPTAVFYWNVAKNKFSYFLPPDPTYADGWPWGTSRVNLGDANGDGKTDLSFIAGSRLWCLTTDASDNLVQLWAAPRVINDSRSGVLTVTIYDFDNDGNPEMVYRDSQELVIIDGATGTQKLWSAICQSHTYTEGPVIADVNGDGATDICVACNRNNSFDINDPIQQQALGEVRLFFSNGNEWLPTRKVWNQPGYFVVNINDDLTLPFPQLDQSLIFSNNPCPNGLPGPQMPLNVFLNQVPHLSADGCPVFPAPDLSFVGDDPENLPFPPGDPRNFPAVVVTPPICGNLDIKVSFNIINDGDLPITAAVPVSFFHGDPTDPGITSDSLLFSTTINVTNLQVGDTLTTAPVTFNGPGVPFRLFIVLNNDGTILPIDPTGSVSNECRIDNNIYDVFVTPDPFTATIEKIKDSFKCGTAPDNGELRAHIFKGLTEVVDYSPYAFEWRDAANTVVSTNYNATGLAQGTYSLVVTNTQKGCSSTPVFESIVELGNNPDVSIIVRSNQTQCNPPNGQLEAVIVGGNTGYTFEWFDIALTPLGITGAIANNLTEGNYVVRVSKDGCSKISPEAIVDGPQIPDAQAQTLQNVVNCANLASGSVSADALFNTVIQDPAKYTFDWYFYDNATSTRGSILPPVHGAGQTRTGLPVGFYQVVITEIATQCPANQQPITEVTDATVLPTVDITELAPQTSCDPANPNGRLAADAFILGSPADPATLTFEWFRGDNTLPANLHTNVSGVSGRIAEGVSGGGVFYTVKVTTQNNCSATDKLIITEDVNVPVVTLTPVDNSICDPALAASAYNGSVTATVTFKGSPVTDFSGYQFKWYDGSQTTDPAIVVADDKNPVLSQRDGGFYTVTAERLDLRCLSLPVTTEVKNVTVLPQPEIDIDSATNCTPALANGSVEVTDVDNAGVGAPYNFKWYDGNVVVPGSEKSLVALYSNLVGSATSFYTLLVTNQSSGCQNTVTVQVPDMHVLPLLSLAPSPNSICDPTLTNPATPYNGKVITTITNQGTNPIGQYTFAWNTGATTKDLIDVQHASYTLTAAHTPTGCVSNPVTAQVLNQTALPVIAAVGVGSTNCTGPPNGKAVVTSVDTNPVAAPYALLWHQGVDLTTPMPFQTNDTLSNRQGGIGEYYTVRVTNESNGCRNTMTVEIPDEKEFPIVTLSATDNKLCTAVKDGTASLATLTYKGAAVASPYVGYSFSWSTGAITPSITQRPAGFYTLTATKVDVGCTSAPAQIEIKDDLFIPPINITATDQTSCDTNNPNGKLAATINQTTIGGGATDTVGYNFVWRNNGSTLPLAIPGTTVTTTTANRGEVDKLDGNLYYTIEVTRKSTGCQNTETLFLPEVIIYPQVVVASTDPVTRCDTPDGEVEANVGGAENGFTFYWLNEVGANQTGLNTDVVDNATTVTPNDGTYSNLIPGYYTVVAENNTTKCLSQPVTREVVDATLQTTITMTLGPGFPSTCGSFDGEMTATVTGGSGGTVDLLWHFGGPVNDSINFFNNPPQFNSPNDVPFNSSLAQVVPAASHIINLESRLYTLVVRDNGNGCGNYETIFLPFQDAHEIDETLTPSSICPYTIGNGEIDVVVSSIPAVPPGLTFQNFSYSLYKGENPDPAQLVTPPGTVGPGAAVTNPMSYTALAPGMYTIEVRQAFGSNCPVYEVVEIESLALPPLVSIVGALTANTACNVNSADGAATISVSQDPNDGTVGFPYDLTVTPNPLVAHTDPLPAAGNYTLNGLKPDPDVPQYSILVTSSNQCSTELFITIPNQPAIAEMVDGNVMKSDAEYCEAALEETARIEVQALSIVNGPADNLSDYRFDWYTNATLTTNVLSAMGDGTATQAGEILSNNGVSPAPTSPVWIGSYWVVATKINAGATGGVGCFSAPFKVDIEDNTVDPVMALTPSANTSCDTNYEGEIEVDVSTASGPGIAPATY